MADPATTSSPTGLRPTLEPLPRSTHQLPRPSPPPPPLSQESADRFDGWETIGEPRGFYSVRDYLRPSGSLSSIKLQNRGQEDVVIFDYSLDPDYLGRADGNHPVEEGGPSPGRFTAADDIFFLVPKDRLVESKQFDQISDPTGERRLVQSRGSRLSIIDFPQCYDTSDENLLNSMAEKLRLPREGATSFKETHLEEVLALPGGGGFRTGISLRVPFEKLSELSKSASSEDRFALFVSVPYFGKSSSGIQLGPESESVRLLDFKCLGVDVPASGTSASEGGEILVHQARYMIFDNYTMATFRSKEDSTKDQVPLHRFQDRVSAFRAVIHMIANRTDSELWTLGKLRASLCMLGADIDKIISDATTYEDEDNQGRGIPEDSPVLPPGMLPTPDGKRKWGEDSERVRKDNAQKRKQRRLRDLFASFNRLSATLFAAISVAEQHIVVLQDLHGVYCASYRARAEEHGKGYPLRQNALYKDITLVPTLPGNHEQISPNLLHIIDEVVRGRESFIKKIKELVGNMDIKRKILSGFLKADQAKTTPSEGAALEATRAMKGIEGTIGRTSEGIHDIMTRALQTSEQTYRTILEQSQMASLPLLLNTMFLPLSFFASYYGMNNIKEFEGNRISLHDFWATAGSALMGILLVTMVLVLWKRPVMRQLRASLASWLRRGSSLDSS